MDNDFLKTPELSIKVSDEDILDYSSKGYVTWFSNIEDLSFCFRTLTREQIKLVREFLKNLDLYQTKLIILSYSLETIIYKHLVLGFPIDKCEENLDILSDFFYSIPSHITASLATHVLDKTFSIEKDMDKILADDSLYEAKKYYLNYLQHNIPLRHSFFHITTNLKKSFEERKFLIDNNWENTKFLAAMWQPKFIKDLEAKEKLKNSPEFNERQLEELSSLVGEDRAREILDKIKNQDVKFEGDEISPESLGEEYLQEKQPRKGLPVRYSPSPELMAKVKNLSARQQKEFITMDFLQNTPDEYLDKHDRSMKRIQKKRYQKILEFLEKTYKDPDQGMKIKEVTTEYQSDGSDKPARDVLKNPIFSIRRNK